MSIFRSQKSDSTAVLPTLSKEYWRESAKEFSDLRKLCAAALIIAIAVLLKPFKLPLSGSLKIGVSFIASAVGGAVLGPLLSLARGAVSDIVGWLVFPDGDFAIGYTLTEALAAMLYSLAFWRKKVTLPRIISVRFVINLVINALVGSLWTKIYFGIKYLPAFAASLAKNLIMLPFEVLITVMLFNAILPPLAKMKLCPPHLPLEMKRRTVIILGISALGILAFAIYWIVQPAAVTALFEKAYAAVKGFFRGILGLK